MRTAIPESEREGEREREREREFVHQLICWLVGWLVGCSVGWLLSKTALAGGRSMDARMSLPFPLKYTVNFVFSETRGI